MTRRHESPRTPRNDGSEHPLRPLRPASDHPGRGQHGSSGQVTLSSLLGAVRRPAMWFNRARCTPAGPT